MELCGGLSLSALIRQLAVTLGHILSSAVFYSCLTVFIVCLPTLRSWPLSASAAVCAVFPLSLTS